MEIQKTRICPKNALVRESPQNSSSPYQEAWDCKVSVEGVRLANHRSS